MKKRVAIFLFEIGDISGGGGAERQWADVFDMFKSESFELLFFTDRKSYKLLKESNRLHSNGRIVFVYSSSSKFPWVKNFIDSVSFIITLFLKRIKIVLCPLYGSHYYKRLRYLSVIPNFFLKPKITIAEVSSFTAHCYLDSSVEFKLKRIENVLNDLYNNIDIAGVISWYELFKNVAQERKLIKSNPYIYAIRHCFTNTEVFRPGIKKNNIVFASRLVWSKRPDWFVEAVNYLSNFHSSNIKGWSFFIYGKGKMEQSLIEMIADYNLGDLLVLKSSTSMDEIFSESKCFISCQDDENFTSLSMMEAMAAGNALVSRNVGQTDYFLKEGKNGYFATEDSPKGIAQAILKVIVKEGQIEAMSKESVRLAHDVHNIENFNKELSTFFCKVLKRNTKL